jgi:hypothetical protein
MSIQINTWEIINGELKPIDSSLQIGGRKEKDDLEKWIKANPKILGNDILLIGEQVYTKSGPLDFLGIDNNGNLVIVELKRDKLPRDVLTQAIDYASDIATWEVEKISEICMDFTGNSLEDYLTDNFENIELDDIIVNKAQRLLLVGFSIDEPLGRMIEWLSSNYDLGINAIILNYVITSSGNELLSKTVIIPEEIEKAKSNKRKFKIPMSDEPGTYDEKRLRELLKNYLNQNQYSSRRIKHILLPALLKTPVLSREKLKEEFVKLGEASDETRAGNYISLISNQLGQAKKDFLRQVIHYEYPNYSWEKDNFSLREEYKELVRELISDPKDDA